MKRSTPALKLRNLPVTPLEMDDDELDRVIDGLRMPQLMAPEAAPPAPREEKSAAPAETAEVVQTKQVLPAPAAEPEEQAEEPIFEPVKTADADIERLTVEIPRYVGDQVRRRAFENRHSTRFIILTALKAYGFDVKPEDLNPNRRRFRVKQS